MAKSRTKVSVGLGLVALEVIAIPFALIARSRSTTSPTPPLRMTRFNMEEQPKFGPQAENPAFADTRAMRPRVEGTLAREDFIKEEQTSSPGIFIPRGQLAVSDKIGDQAMQDVVERGQTKGKNGKGEWVARIPIPVTPQLMHRGQERFNIYCAPCHGYSGYGNGMVNQVAQELAAAPPQDQADAGTKWAPAANYHQPKYLRDQYPDGQVFNTITNGRNSMAGYAAQIPPVDRWAIVAYVRSLQKSQNAAESDVPPEHLKETETGPPRQTAAK